VLSVLFLATRSSPQNRARRRQIIPTQAQGLLQNHENGGNSLLLLLTLVFLKKKGNGKSTSIGSGFAGWEILGTTRTPAQFLDKQKRLGNF